MSFILSICVVQVPSLRLVSFCIRDMTILFKLFMFCELFECVLSHFKPKVPPQLLLCSKL